MQEEFDVSAPNAARIIGVTTPTVLRWEKEGLLEADRPEEGMRSKPRLFFRMSDVQRMADKYRVIRNQKKQTAHIST